ncbi:hypothetical protein ACKKBG_A00610 [Auxenochlorella protothecoides x Auxenochlorella symbiontica]
MRSALLLSAVLALALINPSQATSAPEVWPGETMADLCGSNYTDYEFASDFYGPLQFLEIPDVVVAYYRFGNASTDLPPVVLIMGFSGTMKNWPITMLVDLAEDREVILFDNRGQGFSKDTSPEVPLSIASMANDTKNFVEALDLARPPHLFGWSMGGMITLQAAAVYGDSFDRFAVFSGSAGSLRSQLPSPEIMAEFKGAIPVSDVERLSSLFPLNTTDGAEAACRYARDLQYSPDDPENKQGTKKQLVALTDFYFDDSTIDALVDTERHILVIGGLLDIVVPAQNQKLVGQVLPSAWMAIFQDSSHATFFQHWGTIRELLEVFLQREE